MASGLRLVREDKRAFASVVFKVDVKTRGWQKVLNTVLASVGVTNFRMDEDGRVEISGLLDPALVLKILAKAGKKVEICWWQFGQCSGNLFLPEKPKPKPIPEEYFNYNGYGGYLGGYRAGGGQVSSSSGDGRHLHFKGHGNRPQLQSEYKPYQQKEPPANPPKSCKGVNCCSLM